jgi:hypothetical protein
MHKMPVAHRCPYCREYFFASRFHPDQVVCSAGVCQRRRRAEYHRQKLVDDPEYREQCRESQRIWREEHPEYMREYRRRVLETSAEKPSIQELLAVLLWLICSEDFVKNTLAQAALQPRSAADSLFFHVFGDRPVQ